MRIRHPRTLALALVVATAAGGGLLVAHGRADGDERSCAADGLVTGWSHGTLAFEARSLRSGAVLADEHADVGAETGSTMKVLTATAAISVLGPDHRFTTRVVQGASADTVVLVGGGDPTLSRLPTGQDGVYPDAPHLDDLARQVRAARAAVPSLADVPVRHVRVDTDLFGGPAWNPTWGAVDRTTGSVSNITALMVDGDRDDATNAYSPRGTAAVARAASAFAALLGPDVTTDVVSVPVGPQDRQLAAVRSAPVSALVRTLLTDSDDTLAEVLARHVAVAEGSGDDFAAIQRGTTTALAHLGIPTAGLRLVDGSGLSHEDRVTPDVMTRVMALIAARADGTGPLYDGLPVAGETGTLAEHGRYQRYDTAARGHIRAKTGTLDDMFGLTGVTDEVHGDRVVFTIWAEGTADPRARRAIDDLATAVWRCGGDL